MHLHPLRHRSGGRQQPVGLRAVVADLQVAGADLGARWRRARPGMANLDVAFFVVMRPRGSDLEREECEQQRNEMFQLSARMAVGALPKVRRNIFPKALGLE